MRVIVFLFLLATQNFQPLETPLMRAAEAGRVDEVRRLLQRGADVNEKLADVGGLTALMVAARRGRLEVVKILLQAGADPNASGGIHAFGFFSPLTFAMNPENKNRLELIDVLIAGGARLNPPDSFPESPLDAAIDANDIGLVRELLKRGSDVNWANKFGSTPLSSAITTGKRNVDIVRLLLDSGADPNKPRLPLDDDCVSLLKWLDEEQKTAPNTVAAQLRSLVARAGGRTYATNAHHEPCKVSAPSRHR